MPSYSLELPLFALASLESDMQDIQVNWFGMIPTLHQPRKWRLILDLSHPAGNSVNDGMEPELCSLTYASIDDTVELVLKMGKEFMLATLDLLTAFPQYIPRTVTFLE